LAVLTNIVVEEEVKVAVVETEVFDGWDVKA